ncbi:hypothetical protein FACS1894190_14590 [Spirochaetia bacterium]|nr:hypothetical protein FACS1894190_14590 [Spirochaetia bacterium]
MVAAGAQPVIGFNYGAKNYKRVREAFKYVLFWTFAVSAIATVLFESIPGVFIAAFGSDGEPYTNFAVSCLRIYLALIIFTCVQKACAIFLQSVGKPAAAIPLAMIRDVILLIIFSCILPVFFGVRGIFWAAPSADIVAMLITAIVVMRIMRNLDKGADAKTAALDNTELQTSHAGIIITISRQHGSGGQRIGKLVSEKLNIPFYYKEMTTLAGHDSGLSAEFISSINKESPDGFRNMYMDTEIVQQAIIAQNNAIVKIADAGSCVIVGRAADYILRDRKNVVRVFIHAPLAYKIKMTVNVYGDSEEEARKNIAKQDAARSVYHKHVSGTTWGDFSQYELSIDSSIGEEQTANIICEYVKSKS